MKRIAIIGGGFAGLGAAYRLSGDKDVHIEIFERSEDIGGLAGAFPVGGSYLEQYYHHFFPIYDDLLALAKEIGIDKKVFFKKAKSGNFVQGKIYPFSSALDVLRFSPISFFDRLRLGFGIAYLKMDRRWQKYEDIPAVEWLKKYFGTRVFEVIWKPLLVGKFGDHAGEISMAWFWSRVYERPSEFGYIEGGFKTLTDALGSFLKDRGVIIHLSTPVLQVAGGVDGRVTVQTNDGTAVFDAAIVAATPMAFSRMAKGLPAEYLQRLEKLKYYGTVSLVLTLDRSFSPYYWLNIQDLSMPILAVVEHTNFVSPDKYGGNHLLYVAKYLDPSGDLYRMPDELLLSLYLESLKKIRPDFDRSWVRDHKIFRAPATQPIIFTGYQRERPAIKTPVPNLYFISMSHIYPWDRGTNHSFHLGKEAGGIIESEVL